MNGGIDEQTKNAKSSLKKHERFYAVKYEFVQCFDYCHFLVARDSGLSSDIN